MSLLHPKYDICGIDISRHQIWSDPQKSIDMGVSFVIIRAGNAKLRDIRYIEHRAKAEKFGIPCAFYWYWQPGYPAKDQARAMRNTLHSGDRVYLDFEHNEGDHWPAVPTMQLITQLALEMVEECDNTMGDEVGIYSNFWWSDWIVKGADPKFRLSMRSLWLAAWSAGYDTRPSKLPHGWSWADIDIRQFSGIKGPWRGKSAQLGITYSANIDVDHFNGDADKFAKIFKVKQTEKLAR